MFYLGGDPGRGTETGKYYLSKFNQSVAESCWLSGIDLPPIPNYHVQVHVALKNLQAKTRKYQQVDGGPLCKKTKRSLKMRRGNKGQSTNSIHAAPTSWPKNEQRLTQEKLRINPSYS